MLACLFSLLSVGQTTPPSSPDSPAQAPAQNQPAQQPPAGKDKGKDKDKASRSADERGYDPSHPGTSNDRLFYALPNFLTLENTAKVPPLTTKQKFAVVARGTFDPAEFPWWGAIAAISQAENSEPAFGQGWGAYAKRYGTTAGDSLVENFMVGAVFPSLLHQDPRFFQSSGGSLGHRAWYSVTRIFVTRTDSGHPQFNYSEIFGSATAAAISTYTYHPRSTYLSTPSNPHLFVPSDRTLLNAANVWGTQVGLDTITIAIKEFWPDLHRKASHKSKEAQAGSWAR